RHIDACHRHLGQHGRRRKVEERQPFAAADHLAVLVVQHIHGGWRFEIPDAEHGRPFSFSAIKTVSDTLVKETKVRKLNRYLIAPSNYLHSRSPLSSFSATSLSACFRAAVSSGKVFVLVWPFVPLRP